MEEEDGGEKVREETGKFNGIMLEDMMKEKLFVFVWRGRGMGGMVDV